MRNNREPFILIILIVFLLFKSNQPDSSSYRFSAELDNWKRYNYPREIKEEPFIVVEKNEDSKSVRNTFDRVFKHNDENEKEKEINNENIKNQHTVKNVITWNEKHVSDFNVREAKHGSEHGMILDNSHVKGKEICYSCKEKAKVEEESKPKSMVVPAGVMTTWATRLVENHHELMQYSVIKQGRLSFKGEAERLNIWSNFRRTGQIHPFEKPLPCSPNSDLAILVRSETKDSARRNEIRDSWGNQQYWEKNDICVIHVIGIGALEDVERNDVLQVPVLSREYNIPLLDKVALSFLQTNFQGDKVLIVDADIVVFPKQISWRLEQVPNEAFIGACITEGWKISDKPLVIGFIPEEMRSEYPFSFPAIKPDKSFILLSAGTAFGLANLLNKPKYASYPDSSMNLAIAFAEMGIRPTKLGEVCLGLGKVSPKIYPDLSESADFDLEFDLCLHRGLSARRVTKNENILKSFINHMNLECPSPSKFNFGEISEPMQKIQQHLLSTTDEK